jgi:hypothetical protein
VVREGTLCWESLGAPVERLVQLRNISLRGCLVECRGGPGHQPGLHVTLKCPSTADPEGIEGVLLGTRKPFLGAQRIRIRFLEALSFDAFKLLVYGPDDSMVKRDDIPEHEKDIYWR